MVIFRNLPCFFAQIQVRGTRRNSDQTLSSRRKKATIPTKPAIRPQTPRNPANHSRNAQESPKSTTTPHNPRATSKKPPKHGIFSSPLRLPLLIEELMRSKVLPTTPPHLRNRSIFFNPCDLRPSSTPLEPPNSRNRHPRNRTRHLGLRRGRKQQLIVLPTMQRQLNIPFRQRMYRKQANLNLSSNLRSIAKMRQVA